MPPNLILFDWHGTLVDTIDAMYSALDELFPLLAGHGLLERLIDTGRSRSVDDAKLVGYVRKYRHLHPKIRAERKVSRTDIFEVLFGGDEEAKRIAHDLYNQCYRHHYGEVRPFEPGIRDLLFQLRALGIRLGVASNRNREFIEHELTLVEGGSWRALFDTVACGDDAQRRKPAPDTVLNALSTLGLRPDPSCWYVGDSTTDTASAKLAGVTSVFYNGASWEPAWLAQIFPGTLEHPHCPDAVVDNFSELLSLVKGCMRTRQNPL